MTGETSAEAVAARIDEMLGWLTGPDSGQNDGICATVRALRALATERDAAIARAEAAERERDDLVADITVALTTISQEADARISAEAQLEQAREALEIAVSRGRSHCADSIRDARATLAAIDKKEPGQ